MFRPMISILIIGTVWFSTAFAASLEKAEMFRTHGLTPEAKRELIDVIFSNQPDTQKAEAYYILGTIAFGEKNIFAALETWTELIKKFPGSSQARLVKDRIRQLSEIVGEVSKWTGENAIAQSYFRHADFWSEHKSKIFRIDASWLPMVEGAIKWYDKIIEEFPKTTASRLAYEDKMRTLIGWKESGRYAEAYGVEGNFSKYMPMLLETFVAFEKDHPDASTLQAFRYQIAQQYWKNKNWVKTREWLNLIIQKSGDQDTFYCDLAKRRLEKMEY